MAPKRKTPPAPAPAPAAALAVAASTKPLAAPNAATGHGGADGLDVRRLRVGDFLSSHNYYVVEGADDSSLHVRDMEGERLRIAFDIVTKECLSSDLIDREKKVTRTELSHVIQSIGHAAFRVTFKKQPTADNLAAGLDAEDTSTPAKRLRVLKKLLEGEERVLHGRIHRTADNDPDVEFGRIRVVDLAAASAATGRPAFRLVDTRSISELIVEGTRYYV
jgi:hypothetical protein